MPKYVLSSTLQNASWNNSTILRGDLAEEVSKLKGEVEGVILVAGSARLAQGLLKHGLVDELRLTGTSATCGGVIERRNVRRPRAPARRRPTEVTHLGPVREVCT